jgi:hypothetical protein
MAVCALGETAAAGSIGSSRANGFTRANRARSARDSWSNNQMGKGKLPTVLPRGRAANSTVRFVNTALTSLHPNENDLASAANPATASSATGSAVLW